MSQPYVPAGLCQHLAALLQPEMIFAYGDGLLLVVSLQQGKTMAAYKSLAQAATAGHDWPLPSLYFYEDTEVRAGIEEGNLYYSTVFTTEHLVYRSGKALLPLPLHQRLGQALTLCRSHFDTGMQRSLSFADGARMYHRKGEQDMAAFMVHQSIELLLRHLLLAVTNKEVRSHNLRELLQHCRSIAPALYNRSLSLSKGQGEGGSLESPGLRQAQPPCFGEVRSVVPPGLRQAPPLQPTGLRQAPPPQPPLDRSLSLSKGQTGIHPLILQLDKAYTCARYAQHFAITAAALTEALQLVNDLQELARSLMDQLLQPLTQVPEAGPALWPLQAVAGKVYNPTTVGNS